MEETETPLPGTDQWERCPEPKSHKSFSAERTRLRTSRSANIAHCTVWTECDRSGSVPYGGSQPHRRTLDSDRQVETQFGLLTLTEVADRNFYTQVSAP